MAEFGVERTTGGLLVTGPCCMGTARLVNGVVTVNCKWVTADTLLFIARQEQGVGTIHENRSARVPGVSFELHSGNAADNTLLDWIGFEPIH